MKRWNWEFGLALLIVGSIVSLANAQEALEIRSYKCGDDLLETNRFVGTVTSFIAPTEWDLNGGKGSVVPTPNKPGSFDIWQSPSNHQKIKELLDLLSLAQGATSPKSNNGFWNKSEPAVMLRKAFQRTIEFQCDDQSIESAVARLAKSLDVDFDFNGVDKKINVRYPATNETLGQHLNALLSEYKLGYRIEDGKVIITKRSSSASEFLAVYPILDPPQDQKLASVMQNLMQSVTPDEWTQSGGTAVLMPLSDRMLLVSHRPEGHLQVAKALGFVEK